MFFFSTWKSGRHTWKKSIFSAWKREPVREKIMESAREKRILCVKIFRKSDFSKNFHAQNREIPISACKTENGPYVKIFDKVPVKAPDCAWNLYKSCAWKPLFVREKTQKRTKKSLHAHFFFSRRKKNTGAVGCWTSILFLLDIYFFNYFLEWESPELNVTKIVHSKLEKCHAGNTLPD